MRTTTPLLATACCMMTLTACNPWSSPATPPASSSSSQTSISTSVRNVSIQPGDALQSGVEITGEARGPFFAEGSFPVELVDEQGAMLAQGLATADGEWMTEDFVPFSVEPLQFSTTASKGMLILKKDNPSGLPEHDETLEIPVVFVAQ